MKEKTTRRNFAEVKTAVLAALEKLPFGTAQEICREVGHIERSDLYAFCRKDPELKEAWQNRRDNRIDMIEEYVMDVALGHEICAGSGGSNRLSAAKAMLSVFRAHKIEVGGKNGGAVEVTFVGTETRE